MSDADHENTISAIPSEEARVAPAEKTETKAEQSEEQLQIAGPPATLAENGAVNSDIPAHPESGVDGDSEAETLIESPEKKRGLAANVVESAPRLQPTQHAGTRGQSVEDDSILNDAEGRKRKRRRTDDDAPDNSLSRNSSRRSSPLSSASSNSDSEASINRTPENTRLRRRNGQDKATISQPAENNVNGTQLRVRKRRPSDILPHSTKHGTKHQSNSIDNNSVLERRETRSATYPRRSSEDGSISPEPIARRGHRRGASTQLSSLALERKRRGQLPQISTRRNLSADRDSTSADDSSSPPPSRPRLHKFASGEHDTISPAKAMVARKTRDRNGRTLLARACNNNEFANAKARLLERPEDLNVADNAGNTPLQIAALEGYADIVEHLLKNGCEVDTMNIDKDTPLIDAVDNHHVDVVKILLEYGADPRKQNAKGEEPNEIVTKYLEQPEPSEYEAEYQEIRLQLIDAKQKTPKRRRTDDQIESGNREGSSRAASVASPHDSPPALGPRSPPAVISRRKTGRSESTPNHLLWQANTPENLIKLAEKGDGPGVANILNVINKAGPESLIAAAKGGHEEVLQLLLGMGSPDPNPRPVDSARRGYNTPMLAAIGRGKPEIIKLLLDQNGFNPTAEFNGRTFYEISEERQGHDWRTEYKLLKEAYDKYAASKPRKHTSPRKSKDSEKDKLRQIRESMSPVIVRQRPQTRSPAMSHKNLPGQISSLSREGRRQQNGPTEVTEKGIGQHLRKPAIDHSTAVSSDQDQTVKKTVKSRRSHSELLPPAALEADTYPKRRRLISGKEHRRAASSIVHEVDSDDDSTFEIPVKHEPTEKPILKRSRSSFSPEQTRSEVNLDSAKNMPKKRRMIPDSSPEDARIPKKKAAPHQSSRESTQTIEVRNSEAKVLSDVDAVFNRHKRRKSSQSSAGQSSRENGDVMEDVKSPSSPDTTEQVLSIHTNPSPPIPAEQPVPSPEEDQAAPSNLDTLATLPEASSSVGQETSSLAARQAQEQEYKKAAEEASKRAIEAAAAAEQKRVEEVEARRIIEEAEAKKRVEEETLAKKKEEEERLEQARRDMEERRRRQEEQKRQDFLENERRRREALPSALCECARMLDHGDSAVRSHDWLKRFNTLYTVTTLQIDPDCTADVRDDEWIPNFQVAGLLATKDLNLRQYTSLERRPVSTEEREALWRVANMDLSYAYYTDAFNTPTIVARKAHDENVRKFMVMEELFWVKWSDFNDQVFRHSHLAGLTLKKQPICIRWPMRPAALPHHSTSTISPMQKEPPLTNGVSPYMSTAMQGHHRF